jgi:predicted nicotinamide N-methyase
VPNVRYSADAYSAGVFPSPTRSGSAGGVAADFVRAHTTVCVPSYLPELRLHLADEAIPLWERTERERGGQQPPPFWAFAWAGGQALARYLLDHPDLVRDRRVFDLAAGSGVVAIAAAMAGAARVTANEIDPYAAGAIAVNAELNAVDVSIILGDVLDGDAADADVVLAGDVFYSRPMTERVLPFLRRAAARNVGVLVGDPGRAYLPGERLTAVARYEIPVTVDLESTEVKTTTVWTLS